MRYLILVLSLFLSLNTFGQINPFYIYYDGIPHISGSTLDINCSTSTVTATACLSNGMGGCVSSTCSNWQLPAGWGSSGSGCSISVTPNSTGGGQLKVKVTSGSSSYDLSLNFVRKVPPTPSVVESSLLICSGGNVGVYASFVPFAYSYTWASEGGASVSSTGFATANVTATGIGKAKVRANADPSTGCPDSGWGEAYVHYGPPTVNGITVNTSMCTGYGQTVSANILGNPTSSSWYVSSGNASNTYLTDYGSGNAYFNSYIADCYGLTLNMSNVCGSSSDGTTICVDDCFARYSAYPNPAKDVINLELSEVRNKDLLPESIELFEEKSAKKVKSIDVKAAFDKQVLKSDGIFRIEVGDLPRGIYYLHINPKEESKQKVQIIRVSLE